MSRLMTPGQRINMRLQKLDITEEQLAQSVGMDPAALSAIMRGQLIASPDQKVEISRALRVKQKAVWKH